MKFLLLSVLFLFPSLIFASDNSYTCQINGEYKISDNGKLLPDNQNIYIDKIFNVERKSGVVLGGGVGNSSYPTKSVIDIGSKDQSFKLIWISKDVIGTNGGKNAVYLTIDEFINGDIKPFSMILSSKVLSGTCQ